MGLFSKTNRIADIATDKISEDWLRSQGFEYEYYYGCFPLGCFPRRNPVNVIRINHPEEGMVWKKVLNQSSNPTHKIVWKSRGGYSQIATSLAEFIWFPPGFTGAEICGVNPSEKKQGWVSNPQNILYINCHELASANFWVHPDHFAGDDKDKLMFCGYPLQDRYIIPCENKLDLLNILVIYQDLVEKYNEIWSR